MTASKQKCELHPESALPCEACEDWRAAWGAKPLTQRLRSVCTFKESVGLCLEALAEIERLERENVDLRHDIERVMANHLALLNTPADETVAVRYVVSRGGMEEWKPGMGVGPSEILVIPVWDNGRIERVHAAAEELGKRMRQPVEPFAGSDETAEDRFRRHDTPFENEGYPVKDEGRCSCGHPMSAHTELRAVRCDHCSCDGINSPAAKTAAIPTWYCQCGAANNAPLCSNCKRMIEQG